MKISESLIPIIKDEPKEANIVSHKLMLKAALIRQNAAGIYTWLPMGVKVLNNIIGIIREELSKIGAEEILMPTMQPMNIWYESGRENIYGKEMLKVRDRHDAELLYSPTNEEMVVDIFRSNVKSYKQLPMTLYQIQWKFRDEIRPRFGVMRGREFLMKDAYSFDLSVEDAKSTYFKIFSAYLNIFKAMNLQAIPVQADTGPIGGDLSHEFHLIAKVGESQIYYDKKLESDALTLEERISAYSAADEKHDINKCPIPLEDLRTARGIEVGHIFFIGDQYTKKLNANIQDSQGLVTPQMGCYGIGVSRLVGAIIEAHHDEYGIIWPKTIAPFHIIIIMIPNEDQEYNKFTEQLYQNLKSTNLQILFDDTKDTAGNKFMRGDLLGIPMQLIISHKNFLSDRIEYKIRKTTERGEILKNNGDFIDQINSLYNQI